MHHGIKGQKWGVRRFQYSDGSRTPAGKLRYSSVSKEQKNTTRKQNVKRYIAQKVIDRHSRKLVREASKSSDIGKRYVDTYLNTNTSFYRIQSSDQFENFAFYATYKKHDINEYAGLFGRNLINRANAEAKSLEKSAEKTGDYDAAIAARNNANNIKIHQLQINNTSRLKIPSEDNAGMIVGNLLKDQDFHRNLVASIDDSAAKMRRPSQQMLFKEAKKSMAKDPAALSLSDKRVIYKALNLSLTNHNEQEVAMQSKFYGEMKKHGYSALLDLNDKSYSSYHAKSPIIIFDTDKVKLQSVTQMDANKVDKLYKKYNRERIAKDIPEQLLGNIIKAGNIKISSLSTYVNKKTDDYLNKAG